MSCVNTIHELMEKTGARISGHYSDLYVEVNKETKKIISEYKHKSLVSIFRSEVDGKLYYDIPFANDDYWSKKLNNATGGRISNIRG